MDIYGKCGKRFEDNEDPRFTDDYFFYLAFENSQCKDYITEKLYTILRMVGLYVDFFQLNLFAELDRYIFSLRIDSILALSQW